MTLHTDRELEDAYTAGYEAGEECAAQDRAAIDAAARALVDWLVSQGHPSPELTRLIRRLTAALDAPERRNEGT